MADPDFMPAPINNGGTGSVQVGGVRAPDYRQLQAPEQVRTDLPDNGAAARAAELGNVFKEFEGISGEYYNKVQAKAGAIAGAAAGATGHPDYKAGVAQFTAYSQAYNNAATGAYAVEAEAQADDAAARLRVQANNDPNTFRTTYSAVRDAVLKNAPPQAQGMLTQVYNQRLAEGLAAVTGAQQEQLKQTHTQIYDLGVQRLTSTVAALQGSFNPNDQAKAADEHVKLNLLIDGGVKAGLYSPAEAYGMKQGAMRDITAQVFQTQIDRALTDPNGDVMGALNRFKTQHMADLANPTMPGPNGTKVPLLSEPEFQKLWQDATTRIRDYNVAKAYSTRITNEAAQAKLKAGQKLYTDTFLSGKLTVQQVRAGIDNEDLSPSFGRSLINGIQHGSQPTNKEYLFHVLHDPNLLDMTEQDVINLPNISWQDKISLTRTIDNGRKDWPGTMGAKQGRQLIDQALRIPTGTQTALLSPLQRNARTQAQAEYFNEMNALDPAKRNGMAVQVAQKIVKGIQQKEAAADVTTYQSALRNFIQKYGPGGPAASMFDAATYQQRIAHYQMQLKQAERAAKGE